MSNMRQSQAPRDEPAPGATQQVAKAVKAAAISPAAAGWFGAGILALALICFVIVSKTSVGSLGSEALAGTTVLAVGLVALIILSRAVGIAQPNAALGLPNGSIRALLALGLAIVFVSVASWTLGGLFNPLGPKISEVRMPQSAIAAFRALYDAKDYVIGQTGNIAAGAPSDEVVMTVYLKRTTPNQEVMDLAKQIVTIAATVLVTVVGFYFGSNSSSEAVRTLQSALLTAQGGAASPVRDAAKAAATAIADFGAEIAKKMSALGADPMAALAATVREAGPESGSPLTKRLSDAQLLFTNLKGIAGEIAAGMERAKTLSNAILPDAADADVVRSRDQLIALRAQQSDLGHRFDQALSAFTTTRDDLVKAAAKG